jgi:hypothetical protein
MKDQNKTKQKLIEELEALRKQVTKLKGMETNREVSLIFIVAATFRLRC